MSFGVVFTGHLLTYLLTFETFYIDSIFVPMSTLIDFVVVISEVHLF